MFIGHYAPALLAATARRSPRLGTLFVAAQFVDIAFFGFVLIDVEHLRLVPGIAGSNAMDLYDMPWTHSLAGSIGWAIGFALLLRLLGSGWRGAAIGAAVVLSHWFLDLFVHIPDLTLAGGAPRLGLGLWRHAGLEHAIELGLAGGALAWYARRTSARGRIGQFALAILALVMLLVQIVDWQGAAPTGVVDPVPLSMPLTALAAYLILAALAWWVGTTRETR